MFWYRKVAVSAGVRQYSFAMAAVGDSGVGFGPGPAQTHSNLIDAVHRAIGSHPSAHVKADYGNILARLLQRQAKMHAAGQHGAQSDGDGGVPGMQPGQVVDTLNGPGGPTFVGGGHPGYTFDPQGMLPGGHSPFTDALAGIRRATPPGFFGQQTSAAPSSLVAALVGRGGVGATDMPPQVAVQHNALLAALAGHPAGVTY